MHTTKDYFLQHDLTIIEKHIWHLLQQGVLSAKSPFHMAVLATSHQNIPHARTVIVRQVLPFSKTICCNTDVRSPKVQHINEQAQVSLLFYDHDLHTQIRITAKATIHHDTTLAEEAWASARLSSKLCYTTSTPAGSLLAAPELIDVNNKNVAAETLAFARSNFGVMHMQVQTLDWLFLHHKGKKRALFDYVGQQTNWIQV